MTGVLPPRVALLRAKPAAPRRSGPLQAPRTRPGRQTCFWSRAWPRWFSPTWAPRTRGWWFDAVAHLGTFLGPFWPTACAINFSGGLRTRAEITCSVAAAWAGALAAYVLENILEIALLFLRIFLRARSRTHSADAPGLDQVISARVLRRIHLDSTRPPGARPSTMTISIRSLRVWALARWLPRGPAS